MSKRKTFQIRNSSKEATVREFRIVQSEGGLEVARRIDFCNLDAILRFNEQEIVPDRAG